MATDTNGLISSISSLGNASAADRAKSKDAPGTIGQDEFLTLLVEQLKAQDPLDPMKNDQFAVDLAQFSQLEQLVELNDKFDSSSSASVAGLAGFLGQEVTVDRDTVTLGGEQQFDLRVDVPKDVSSLSLSFVDSKGAVVETVAVPVTESGAQHIDLSEVTNLSGTYGVKASATTNTGAPVKLTPDIVGIVSGFIPGADPRLIVGGEEISLKDVRRVDVPSA